MVHLITASFTILFLFKTIGGVNYGNLIVDEIKVCNAPGVVFIGKIDSKNVNGVGSIRIRTVLKEPLGNDNQLLCNGFALRRNSRLQKVLSVKSNGLCRSFNRMGRHVWLDMQREIGLTPGACPIAKGNVSLDWYKMDYSQMPFVATIPPGSYFFDCKVQDMQQKLKVCFSLNATKIAA